MMQILANIVFSPVVHLPGKVRLPVPLTFKMMVDDIGSSTQGGLQTILDQIALWAKERGACFHVGPKKTVGMIFGVDASTGVGLL